MSSREAKETCPYCYGVYKEKTLTYIKHSKTRYSYKCKHCILGRHKYPMFPNRELAYSYFWDKYEKYEEEHGR
jgi:hypothetical protein